MLPLTTLCVDDDEGVTKVLGSSLGGIVHAFVHSSLTLWHVTDALFPFEVHWSPQTKQCKLSKWYCFWLQNRSYVSHRAYKYTVWPSAGKQKLTIILVQRSSMQVNKGMWRMRELCVPGSLSSSPAQAPGNEAKYCDTRVCRWYIHTLQTCSTYVTTILPSVTPMMHQQLTHTHPTMHHIPLVFLLEHRRTYNGTRY